MDIKDSDMTETCKCVNSKHRDIILYYAWLIYMDTYYEWRESVEPVVKTHWEGNMTI